jgi:hypothetical protein
MSTNIVEESQSNGYYKRILDGTAGSTLDAFGLIRSALTDDGIESGDTFDLNYNPFFDYSDCSLIINTDNSGSLDYSNVIIKLKVKPGFVSLVQNDYIKCNENTSLIYALTMVDNYFEINDKKIFTDLIYGKKLLWFAVPPIVQHTGGSDDNINMSQFKIDDTVFGPSDLALAHGAALHGKFPVDIFRVLRSVWVE